MDSLLATYASSDDEEDLFTGNLTQNPKTSSVFSSLPPPNSSSSFSFSLPPPKSNPPPQTLTNLLSLKQDSTVSASKIGGGPAKSSSLFSALPQPKSSPLFSKLPEPNTQISDSKPLTKSSSSTAKKVVQFRPPINPSVFKSNDDEEDDDEEEKRRKAKKAESMNHTPTVKSFLSSIPAPKNSSSLGALPNSSGTGRRSILEADVPASNSNSASTVNEGIANSNIGNYDPQSIDSSSVENTVGSTESSSWGSSSEHYANYDGYGSYGNSVNAGSASEVNANYDSYGSYDNYGHYENNWVDASSATLSTEIPESLMKIPGKRGRSDIPHKIIEVKQDELIKNRPREDQTKLTGIAFGPSYQPVSTKGKPSKLHKRKHQIGTLYFEMRQKETELAERRSKGFLTKAETQAKYGW